MFKEYKDKTLIQATLFKEGMEDGFITRYYNDEDVHQDGTISTSGFIGEHEIKVAYVLLPNGGKIMSSGFEREYLCIINGVKKFIEISEFESKYEAIDE